MAENSVETPGSPLWWMAKLSRRQQAELNGTQAIPGKRNSTRKVGVDELNAWLEGDPPLPEGAPEWMPSYQHFHRSTRTNYAELIVESARERMTPIGFRTGASNDRNGDAVAASLWIGNNMPVEQAELVGWMLGLRSSYTMVTPPRPGRSFSTITVEDPRQVITAHDPVDRSIVRAAMKMYRDEDEGTDVVWIYIRGENGEPARGYRAQRNNSGGAPFAVPNRSTEKGWTFDPEPVVLPTDRVPFVRFLNVRGKGEFETHLDLLSRLNQTTLQRMLIAELQAFRQRAVEGLPEVYPADWPVPEMRGKQIDYQGVFTPGPGALWQVPPGVKFWESQPIDLRPLLEAEDKDIRRLASLTRMPIAYFNPDAANGSAEGASFQREGLVYRVEDRQTVAGAGLAQTLSLAFEMQGDRERADVSKITTLWAPTERLSLSEKYTAALAAKNAGLAKNTIRREVLGWTPEQIELAQEDDEDDFLLAQQVAQRELIQAQRLAAVQPPSQPATGPRPVPAPAQSA